MGVLVNSFWPEVKTFPMVGRDIILAIERSSLGKRNRPEII